MSVRLTFGSSRCAVGSVCALIVACALPAWAQNDCRPCHAGAAARSFEHIYREPARHHPVGIPYPTSNAAADRFHLPDGRAAGLAFFDRNGNGAPEPDEIRLFAAAGRFVVECASCHDPDHGAGEPPAKPGPMALRTHTVAGVQCVVCHKQ